MFHKHHNKHRFVGFDKDKRTFSLFISVKKKLKKNILQKIVIFYYGNEWIGMLNALLDEILIS